MRLIVKLFAKLYYTLDIPTIFGVFRKLTRRGGLVQLYRGTRRNNINTL